MNTCILMAEIIQEPQLRYTADSQIPIAEMLVQFTSNRPNDPPSTLKVIGWGNLAQEIGQNYHVGDAVVIEGRLGMMVIDRQPEGFKEKRAELVAQRIYTLSDLASGNSVTNTNSTPSNVVPLGSRNRTNPNPQTSGLEYDAPETRPPVTPNPQPSQSDTPGDDDPIPF